MITKLIILNITLFADTAETAVPATTQGNTTETTGMAAEMSTFHVKNLLENLRANLVFAQFGKKYDIPTGNGKTLSFRRAAALPTAMTPITEGQTPAATKLSVSSFSATVAQYGAWTKVSDLLKATARDKIIATAIDELSAQGYKTLDTVIRNALDANSSVHKRFEPSKSGSTQTEVTVRSSVATSCILTLDTILKATRDLLNNDVPKINGEYVCILHPDVAMDLMRSDEWKEIHKYAQPSNIYNGDIGSIGGVRFVQTTNAPIYAGEGTYRSGTSGAKVNVYGCYLFGADAYATTQIDSLSLDVIVKTSESSDTSNPLNLFSTVGWKATQAACVLDPDRIVKIECTSSFESTQD